MHSHFEATGNLDDWPPNESGKPTQAAVYGVLHPERGKVCEILWTAQFPDLEPAMYWAAKKEVHAVRRDKWIIASRVLWQHDLTPEQAVDACYQRMGPQLDAVMRQMEAGEREFDVGEGPMRPVDPAEVHGHYVEVTRRGEDDAAEPLASFFLPRDANENDIPVQWTLPQPADPQKWIMPDPRQE
jgi:hypothetical protein